MPNPLIERLRELSERATPGDWAVDPDDRPGMAWNNHIVQAADPNFAICFMTHDGTPANRRGQANARLICELRNALPALLSAMQEERERAIRECADRLDGLARAYGAINVDVTTDRRRLDYAAERAIIEGRYAILALLPSDRREEG